MLHVSVSGLSTADRALRRFEATVADWTPFWRILGQSLSDEAQARWPLRRQSGRLRQSLTWAGGRLGRFGVFESSPAQLRFGTAIFYGRFAQTGTKRQRVTPIIHVDEADANTRLSEWTKVRARAAGLEVK